MAFPTNNGDGAYLQHNKYFYELVCDTAACNWITKSQQLRNPVSNAVVMNLPPGYKC